MDHAEKHAFIIPALSDFAANFLFTIIMYNLGFVLAQFNGTYYAK